MVLSFDIDVCECESESESEVNEKIRENVEFLRSTRRKKQANFLGHQIS